MTVATPPPADLTAALPLFRPQAQAARSGIVESPLRLRAGGLHRLALLLLALTLSLGFWIGGQPYVEKLSVSGFAQRAADRVAVRADISGRVSEILVAQGDVVTAGTALLRVTTDSQLADGRSAASARLLALQSEEQALAQSTQLAARRQQRASQRLQAQLQASRTRGRHLLGELQASTAEYQLERQQLANVARLVARGALAAVERSRSQRALLASERARLAATRALADHEAQRRDIRAQLKLLEQTQAETEAGLRAAEARLAQRRIELHVAGERQVSAPVAGTISALTVHQGQQLKPGQLLLHVQAQQQRADVVLLLPSTAMGAVAPGQRVRLRYAGYPYQKFGMPVGSIERISRTPVIGAELELPINPAASVYQVSVRVHQPLRRRHDRWFDPAAVAPGMQVEADVLVRSDPIWRRALEPLLRFWRRA